MIPFLGSSRFKAIFYGDGKSAQNRCITDFIDFIRFYEAPREQNAPLTLSTEDEAELMKKAYFSVNVLV